MNAVESFWFLHFSHACGGFGSFSSCLFVCFFRCFPYTVPCSSSFILFHLAIYFARHLAIKITIIIVSHADAKHLDRFQHKKNLECKSRNMWLAFTNITHRIFVCVFDWWESRTTSCAAPCEWIIPANDALNCYISEPKSLQQFPSLQLLLRLMFGLFQFDWSVLCWTQQKFVYSLCKTYFTNYFSWNVRNNGIFHIQYLSGKGMKRNFKHKMWLVFFVSGNIFQMKFSEYDSKY